MMNSGFAIAVSSEGYGYFGGSQRSQRYAQRMGRIVVAYDKKGNPITTEDLM